MKPCIEFWSNVRVDGFLPPIMEALRGEGFEVRHRALISAGRYRAATGLWGRWWLRFQMYAFYPLYLAARVLAGRKPAVLVVSSNPFFAPAVALLLRLGKARKVVHLVYDLYPECLAHAGAMRSGNLIYRLLDKLQSWMVAHADANVFLGKHLRDYVMAKTPAARCPAVIPVGANEKPFLDQRPQSSADSGPVQVLYCGNMGPMHDPHSLAALMQAPGPVVSGAFRFCFHASGVAYEELQAAVSPVPAWVTFAGFLSEGQWAQAMRAAAVALVVMGQGAEKVLLPSKAFSALVAGQAILAIAPLDSDLAGIVQDEDCGWVVPPGEVEALRTVLEAIAHDPDELLRKRQRAYDCGHQKYSSGAVARQWRTLIEHLY